MTEWLKYKAWQYRMTIRYWFTETLPWKIAWLLPRKVAYLAFMRVYGVLGECGPDFDPVCDEWERRGK